MFHRSVFVCCLAAGIGALLVPSVGQAEGRSARAAQVSKLRHGAESGAIPWDRAVAQLTDAELATWDREHVSARAALRGSRARQARAREVLATWAKAPRGPIPGLSELWREVARALSGQQSNDPVAVAQALAISASAGVTRTLRGRLTADTAAGLVLAALGEPKRAPGLSWTQALNGEARAWLRQQLTGGAYLDDAALGEAVARAIGLGAVFAIPVITGITRAPELSRDRRAAVTEAVVMGLAGLPYATSGLRWRSRFEKTVRPWLLGLLRNGTDEERWAAARFPVFRVEALGGLDDAAETLVLAVLAQNAVRPVLVGAVFALFHRKPDRAAPLLKRLKLTPARFEAEGPWDVRAKALEIASQHCDSLPQEALGSAQTPEVTPDPKVEAIREARRQGTAKILAILDKHQGPVTVKLSFRRCEVWLQRFDMERVGDPRREKASQEALACLKRHVEAFPEHDAGRLELARMLEIHGQDAALISQLIRLVDAKDGRSRILGSYRLLGWLAPDGAPRGDTTAVPRKVARRAARQVKEHGFNPHQRTYATLILAWLEATEGHPKAAFEQMVRLLDAVRNPDGGGFAFAHMAGLIDYTNALSVAAEIPLGRLAGLYANFKPAVRRSALLQLAHLYARHGRARDVGLVDTLLAKLSPPPSARLVMIDAKLREYGPEARGADGAEARNFDRESALAAVAELDMLEPLRAQSDPQIAAAATCVMLGYAEEVSAVLLETGQAAPARRVLTRALAAARQSDQPALMLRLADVEERLGHDKAAVALYQKAFARAPKLAETAPLATVDYYRASARAATDRGAATALMSAWPEALVTAIREAYANAVDRGVALNAVAAIFHGERQLKALARYERALRTASETAAADFACTRLAQAQVHDDLLAAGMLARFEGGERAFKSPAAMCEAALPSGLTAAARQGLVAAARHANRGLGCAQISRDRIRLALVATEARRLLGETRAAAKAMTRVPKAGRAPALMTALSEKIAFSALMGGDLETAERLLAKLDTPNAARMSAHLAFDAKRYAVAAKRFEALAATRKGELTWTLWAARAHLLAGDDHAWTAALEPLTRSRKAAERRAALRAIRQDGDRSPKARDRLLAKLARRRGPARGLRAVQKARESLEKTILPLAQKSVRRSGAARKTQRRLLRKVARLMRKLKPALPGRRGVPSVEVLLPAVEVLVGGLSAMHEFLTANEGLLTGRSKRRAAKVERSVVTLEELALLYGRSAVAVARQAGYVDEALRRMTDALARRFPEDVGEWLPYARVCPDEQPAVSGGDEAAGVPGALGRLAAAGHGVLASTLAERCMPEEASRDAAWMALRWRLLSDPAAHAPESVRGAAAAALAQRAAAGATLPETTREALALHFAGVDCARSLALLKGLTTRSATAARVRAACSQDETELGRRLAQQAQSGGPRAMRRWLDFRTRAATTEADARALSRDIASLAEAARLPESRVMQMPVCLLPAR